MSADPAQRIDICHPEREYAVVGLFLPGGHTPAPQPRTGYVHAPGLRPTITTDPCPACAGTGATGERVALPDTDGPHKMLAHPTGATLLMDVICPLCAGCGSALHATCHPSAHAQAPPLADDLPDEPDGPLDVGPCYCDSGCGWWPMHAFPVGEVPTVLNLRAPCICSGRLVIGVDHA